ncbi:hypothetical protein M5K25_000805 [Dendrobium thyrsiflorum]|uniref:Uncharacterized protein n=1 Tax=Dendrobium thyrsiflorum TaxID=117978 RepID=A0ABD0VUI0_DENTH
MSSSSSHHPSYPSRASALQKPRGPGHRSSRIAGRRVFLTVYHANAQDTSDIHHKWSITPRAASELSVRQAARDSAR